MNRAGWVQDQTTKQARAISVMTETRAYHRVYLGQYVDEFWSIQTRDVSSIC
jgi:hypothetical protein